ncbi:cytochrome P450 [Alkalihalobacillus deserti]|uniref:cytochrome P450 n=1 Tax=Alkalihalobacillus deserti TaxID=2879466 RepID=UPI001D13E810|nr:cytochrome P450 [Alkalihalobacillus deserti]
MDELKKYQQSKGPKGNLLTGNLSEFQKDPLSFMAKLAKDYGDIAPFRLGPFQKIFLVSNPELIKEILVTKQQKFSKSLDLQVVKDIVGEGLLTSEKDFHLSQRRLIQPAFKHTHIMSYAQSMIDVTSKYIDGWEHGKDYWISKDMMNITLGIISKTMFNMEFEKGAKVIGEPLDTYMKLAIKRMRAILKWPLWIPTKSNRTYKRTIRELDDVLYKIIEKRRNSLDTHQDLLGILMAARNEENGLGMSDRQLRDELMTIFLAGHETTGNALIWTLFLLSQNPRAEQKLHEELDQVVGARQIRPDDFNLLLYTQNIIRESLRLFPPAYVIGRQVDEDLELGGTSLKKGDMIMISQYVMQRDARFFENPDSFIPERFEGDLLKKIPTYAYFPFGGGPRVCIGNHFAHMEAVLVLACICQRYRFSLADHHHEIKPQPLITLRPRRGIQMHVENRK